MNIKMASLFDGSGGFPLASIINGIEPVWASEIEPYPLNVTAKRFPKMEQMGDIKTIVGSNVPPVDIVTFGSPCQDLSIAGKQKGIHNGERSNLFFEAIRIIKEMRKNDETNGRTNQHARPRFAVWENVPGAFSSNKGADFQAVLQTLVEVKESGLSVPQPQGGKWKPAGCIVGNGFSIAWRVYDAQFWGTPQRRKRIYLVADFGGEHAGEILFEPESMCRDSEEGEGAREGAAAATGGGIAGNNPICFKERAGKPGGGKGILINSDNHAFTLSTLIDQHIAYPTSNNVCFGIGSYHSKAWTSGNQHSGIYEANVARTLDLNGGNPACNQGGIAVVYDMTHANDVIREYREATPTLQHRMGTGGNQVPIKVDEVKALDFDNPEFPCLGSKRKITGTLMSNMATKQCLGNQEAFSGDYHIIEKTSTSVRYVVRRLTPLECCRLQGFPDWWEDGAEGSDSARYKMWGNGIALPCAVDVLGRVAKKLEEEHAAGQHASGFGWR